ncbi:MAG TPA: hypothetical protein VH396_22415 [Chitinophagaceae bacterium]|jgi:hypothetical protein
MTWWSSIFKKRAEDWFYTRLPQNQTPNDIEIKEISANEEYIKIYLKSLRIVNIRQGLARFYGVVHSFITIPHRGGKEAEFNTVTTAGKLQELDPKNIDRVLNIDKPLLGPIPYRGGKLDMEIGLFSIKSADLAAPFLNLLTKMSDLAGVSYIASALPYAEPLKDGINLLTGGADDTVLEIGISKTFEPINTGYYIVMRAPKEEIAIKDLQIDNDYKLMDVNKNPIKDYPYLVFQIFTTKERTDWFNIPDIASSYKKLQDDVNKGDFTSADESLRFFKRIVLTSNDLIFSDARTIISKVEEETNVILNVTRTATRSRTSKKLKSLSEFNIY